MRAEAEKKFRFRMPRLLGAAALPLLCWIAATRVRLVAPGSNKTHEQVGTISVAGPLAAPKSLSQVGVPVETTRAVVPAGNPQNPEKIAPGEGDGMRNPWLDQDMQPLALNPMQPKPSRNFAALPAATNSK